jgi:hypothetical protein
VTAVVSYLSGTPTVGSHWALTTVPAWPLVPRPPAPATPRRLPGHSTGEAPQRSKNLLTLQCILCLSEIIERRRSDHI